MARLVPHVLGAGWLWTRDSGILDSGFWDQFMSGVAGAGHVASSL